MARLAIVAEDDTVWCLSAWERAIPILLTQGHSLAGIWTCPMTLHRLRGIEIYRWYLRTFGIGDFVKLCAFALIARLARLALTLIGRRVGDFPGLAKQIGVPHLTCASPNDPEIIEWLRRNRVDILLIMTGFILKKPVLIAPQIGTINKHGGALPANRGLFSYFWAFLAGDPQGLTFHKVTPEIDRGGILVQDLDIPAVALTSMVSFYLYIYGLFRDRLPQAITNCIEGRELEPLPGIRPSYHGLPCRKDVAHFRSKGGMIIRLHDVWRAVRLL